MFRQSDVCNFCFFAQYVYLPWQPLERWMCMAFATRISVKRAASNGERSYVGAGPAPTCVREGKCFI